MSAVALAPPIAGREAYRRGASVTTYPVSRGTWTVEARIRKPGVRGFLVRRFTKLANEVEIGIAQIQAQDWLNEQ